jgi:AAA domain
VVAPGARGKSTWMMAVALACASGRAILGQHVFGGPLRVLYINAEDPTAEVALRLRAAMQHHGLKDADVAGLHVAGADRLQLTLLTANRGLPGLNPDGWNKLNSEIDRIKPDILLIDPLVALVGGVSLNDNSAAALMMGRFVSIAAQRKIAIMIAHHAAKNREATSPEAAMGAASLVNLARICLSLEPLAEGDAGKVGVAPWDAHSIFRVIGTKQNLSPPNVTDDWIRLKSVDMLNAEPPVYPHGDSVAVVERFIPNPMSAVFPAPVIAAALQSIGSANPPLSPFGHAAGTSAVAVIAAAIAPHLGGKASNAEAKAVLDYLARTGKVASQPVQVPRPGRGPYVRNGLVVIAAAPTTVGVP